jgi:hypothetical protein
MNGGEGEEGREGWLNNPVWLITFFSDVKQKQYARGGGYNLTIHLPVPPCEPNEVINHFYKHPLI